MGLLGSALGRAVAGAGAGVASLAGKYIDEDLAMKRAEAMADLQRRTAGAIREDEDAFRNDPARVARDRENKRQDVLAAGSAARESELAGLNDAGLQGARRKAKDDDAAADRGRRVADLEATAPAEAKRAGLISEAQARAAAKFREPKEDSAAAVKKKIAAIEEVMERKLTTDEKAALLGMVAKPRESAATEEVVEERDASGQVIGTKTTRKGPAGAPQQDPVSQYRRGIERARAEGRISEAIAELKKQGASDSQLVEHLGVTIDEIRASKQGQRPRASPKAADPQVDRFSSMNSMVLRRIAAIDGHKDQAAAKAELDRRAQQSEDIDREARQFVPGA